MRILALDTALPAVCACVLESGATEPLAMETLTMERGHAEALLPLIERVMVQVEGGFASLDRIAVTVGPGSFTGIRVAVSAARGFGVALDIPVVGVSTLAAFAAPLVLAPKPAASSTAPPPMAITQPRRLTPWSKHARATRSAWCRPSLQGSPPGMVSTARRVRCGAVCFTTACRRSARPGQAADTPSSMKATQLPSRPSSASRQQVPSPCRASATHHTLWRVGTDRSLRQMAGGIRRA